MKRSDAPITFLTPQELADRWKITQMTLRRWRKAGRISAHRLGRGVRFSLDEVLVFETQSKA